VIVQNDRLCQAGPASSAIAKSRPRLFLEKILCKQYVRVGNSTGFIENLLSSLLRLCNPRMRRLWTTIFQPLNDLGTSCKLQKSHSRQKTSSVWHF
jgi:hypothetical protein